MDKPIIQPNDLEAEQSLLGCLFLSKDACENVFASLNAKDFYSSAHQKIYQAMLDNYYLDTAIDYITVSKVLKDKGQLEEVGGLEYITDLTNYVPSAANYKYYAEIVRNDSILREIIDVSQKTINEAYEGKSAQDVLEKAEKYIFDIAQTRRTNDLEHIKKGVNEAIDLMEKISIDPNSNMGVKVGFPTLDKITNGFKPGELIIIAARPGIGKTTLAVNFAINSALKYNKSVAMFDLEMSSLQVAQRFICSTGRVPMDYVKGGTKDNNVWATLFETKKILENSNIYIDDTTTITPTEILSKCRRLKIKNGLDMVIIDYLQLMKSERGTKDNNRQQEVADLTRSIKLAARELGVPIILLSQLNRESEKRADKTPQLSDLRESGSIEQDADIVMFISDVASDNAAEDNNDDALDYSLVIAKHRNGQRGTIPIKWKSEYTQFYEQGKDMLYTKNVSKLQGQKDVVLTPVENAEVNDIFKDE
ncbi:MAG TPA: replicative DNA helicase [Candidatus Onthoplasma faecigallinarum]|nr:replicative DNA helicase [Candidatus Onthoplasma faecigallinarum]